MLVSIGQSKDIASGHMRVFDIRGTRVTLASAEGHLYAFDDGSQFDVTSGAVLRGPARRPVRSRALQVGGGDLMVEADA